MNFFSKFFKKSSSEKEPKSPESKFLPKKKAVIEERFILKFIENGEKIKVVISNNRTIGIDVIQDYELVKKHYEKGKY